MRPCRQLWETLSDAENRHDTSRHSELLDDNVVVHMPGGVVLEGRHAYLAIVEGMFKGLPDYFARSLHVAEVGDAVLSTG